MNLLLTTKNYKKLMLLTYLAKHPLTKNIKTISTALHLSVPSTKRLILDLNNDLVTHFSESIYINISTNSASLINSSPQYSSVDLIEFFKMSYLKDSVPYQILHLLFINKYPSVNLITTELFISRSFFYKTIDELAKPLKAWHIEINLSSKPNRPNFIAKQEHLRAFYVYFFWNTFKQLEWPFESQELILIKQSLNRSNLPFISNSKLRKIEIYLAITNKMINEKNFVILNNDEKQLLLCISDENDLSIPINNLYYQQFSNHSFTNIENEKLFFNFVIRLFSPGIDNSSQIKRIGNNFFHCNNPIIMRSKIFLDYIINKFHLDTDHDTIIEMIYYIVFYFFIFEKLNIDYLAFNKTASPIDKISINSLENKELTYAIKNSVDQFFKKNYSIQSYVSGNTKDVFYNLTYFIISSLQKKSLIVYVQCTKNMHSETLIKKNLTLLFGNDTLKITSVIEDADIVITDSNEKSFRTNQEIYFFEMTHSLETWQELVSFLQKKLIKIVLN